MLNSIKITHSKRKKMSFYFLARASMLSAYMLFPVRSHVRPFIPSVTRVDQSKMVEVRIMQHSLQVAP